MIIDVSHKRITILFLVISLLLYNTSFAYVDLDSSQHSPFEITPCEIYRFHQMKPSGSGFVYNKDTGKLLFSGGLHRCKCGAVVICQGRPEFGLPIRLYITITAISMGESFQKEPWYRRLLWPVYNWANVDLFEVRYTNSHMLMGYRFIPITY